MNKLEERIDLIEKRNKRVEKDKEWEISITRKFCICVITYFVVVLYSYVIKKFDNIFFSSLVPVLGFILSTLSLNIVRKVWENKKY